MPNYSVIEHRDTSRRTRSAVDTTAARAVAWRRDGMCPDISVNLAAHGIAMIAAIAHRLDHETLTVDH